MCVVKEEHRHHGLQEGMVLQCIEEAKRDGTRGSLYTEAICDYPYSQRTFYKCGLRPCGFTFNHYRPTVLVSSFSDPDAYTSLCMLAVPLKNKREGLENMSAEKLDKMMEENGIWHAKAGGRYKPEAEVCTDKTGNRFYSISRVAKNDGECFLESYGPIHFWEDLDSYLRG